MLQENRQNIILYMCLKTCYSTTNVHLEFTGLSLTAIIGAINNIAYDSLKRSCRRWHFLSIL